MAKKQAADAAGDLVGAAEDPAVAAGDESGAAETQAEAPVVTAATVLVEFDGVPDGLVYPRTFAIGERVEGDLAAVAVREGWAEPVEG